MLKICAEINGTSVMNAEVKSTSATASSNFFNNIRTTSKPILFKTFKNGEHFCYFSGIGVPNCLTDSG